MNFGSGGNTKAKAWRDIWGAGQGVGQIFDAPPAAEIVARLKAEYDAARAALFAGETVPTQPASRPPSKLARIHASALLSWRCSSCLAPPRHRTSMAA